MSKRLTHPEVSPTAPRKQLPETVTLGAWSSGMGHAIREIVSRYKEASCGSKDMRKAFVDMEALAGNHWEATYAFHVFWSPNEFEP